MSIVTVTWKFFERKLVDITVLPCNYQYNQNVSSVEGRITLNYYEIVDFDQTPCFLLQLCPR